MTVEKLNPYKIAKLSDVEISVDLMHSDFVMRNQKGTLNSRQAYFNKVMLLKEKRNRSIK